MGAEQFDRRLSKTRENDRDPHLALTFKVKEVELESYKKVIHASSTRLS